MNLYLAKLQALERVEAGQGSFEGFESAQSTPIFESEISKITSFRNPQNPQKPSESPEISKNDYFENSQNLQNLPYREEVSERVNHILGMLGERCPVHIEPDRWRQEVEDGRLFLAIWGVQAQALGWTARHLFGLHTPPSEPAPSYRRLSRYDETGLIWLLEGREVIALTSDTAAIRWPSGSITVYRKRNKPAVGPLGDTLDDLTSGGH